MDPLKYFKKIIEQTTILRSPRQRLSTFGQTHITYLYVSPIRGFKDRSRLREGSVIAEKPKIITPDMFKNRFEGFGKEGETMGEWLTQKYGISLRGLEYKFRNENKSTHIEHSSPQNLTHELEKRIDRDEFSRSALICGPDSTWQFSLMKYIMDESIASFVENLRELDEHGFFDLPEDTHAQKKKKIEELFLQAKQNKMLLPTLGKKLHDYGLFKEYEDRFFSLLKT